MNRKLLYRQAAMGSAFGMFLLSLISPLYIVVGGENISGVVFSRIPGMSLRFNAFDRISIIAFFVLLTVFFICHALYEEGTAKKILSALSSVYCMAYLLILGLVGSNGLVINNFPVISIPLWVVIGSKFFILLPSFYFFLVGSDKNASAFVRTSAFLHAVSLVMILIIKLFEIHLTPFMRAMVFDISISIYLITLAMVTFFMYRKYYPEQEE